MVTGWPDVSDTPYIGAVVLYRVLQRRDGDAEGQASRWLYPLRPVRADSSSSGSLLLIS